MTALQSANLLARFLVELAALGALGYWGFHAAAGILPRIGLAVGAPFAAAAVWAVFVSPNAAVHVPTPVHLLLQAAVLGSAATALMAAGHGRLGAALVAVAVVNWALMRAWGQ